MHSLPNLKIHFTTLIDNSLPLIYTSLPSHLALRIYNSYRSISPHITKLNTVQFSNPQTYFQNYEPLHCPKDFSPFHFTSLHFLFYYSNVKMSTFNLNQMVTSVEQLEVHYVNSFFAVLPKVFQRSLCAADADLMLQNTRVSVYLEKILSLALYFIPVSTDRMMSRFYRRFIFSYLYFSITALTECNSGTTQKLLICS